MFLLVISFYSYSNTRLLIKNAASVSHTHEVQESIEKILSEMTDMETGQRGFIITGNLDFLAPYRDASLILDQNIENLRELTSDNPVQQEHIKEFIALKDQKIGLMKESIESRKAKGFQIAKSIVVNNSGKVIMDALRDVAKKMHSEEDRLLNLRNAQADESTHTAMSVIIGGACISLLIILFALIVLNRAESERLAASLKLESQNLIRSALIQLNEKMAGEQSIASLSQNVIENIAGFFNAKIGAIYLADAAGSLKFTGGYAFQPADGHGLQFNRGEGLVGQAAAQKTLLTVTDVSEDYFKVTSGLGEAKPQFLYLAPFIHEDQVKGVVELGTFSQLSEAHTEYLKLSMDRVAVAFNSAQARLKVAELLQETQAQAEELHAQQEELRANNEELGETTRELEAQQEELRQANEELEEQRLGLEEQAEVVAQASRYKSEFLANMSHELRTPLNSQLILSQMLAENSEGNLTEQQKEFAQTIHSTGLDLLQLINDILDLSKVEAGKLDLDIRDFSLQYVISEWERTFRAIIEKKGLTFKVDIDASAPRSIRSDSHRLSQIVKNFLSNSLKFTSAGEIRLHISRATAAELARTKLNGTRFTAFRVIDTGIGVPADKMQKIFQAFEQVDSSISRQYGGTGLGLAICKKLADMLGGEVLASSEVGKGSAFTLLIPEIAAATPMNEKARDLTPPKAGSGAKTGASSVILIVDDNEILARAFETVAKSAGYQIHIVSNGTDGLQYIETQKPMGVILDSNLPDIRGLEILKKMKANPATADIPVYFISGDSSGDEAEQLGALGFLMKPASSKDFLQALEKIKIAARRKKQHVLVIDDEEIHLKHITRLLSLDQVEVVGTKTAEDAMQILELRGAFDCIVLDLRLPNMSGLGLLEKLSEQKCHTPVIIHTAIDLNKNEEAKLRKYSESIIVKGDRSGDRLIDEVMRVLLKATTDAATPDIKPASLFSAESIFKNKHILVADDDDRNIFALSNALQAKGLKVSMARNGQEALNLLDGQENFDLVLMDIMMPVMDGLEATKRIRMKSSGQNIPIIALTAKAMKGSRESCLAAGANDYLAKPVDMERLFSMLRVWLAKK